MCGKCIKSCENSSVQLNLRLAPQELWAIETPRRADSFLIVAMGAIFFPFALKPDFNLLTRWIIDAVGERGFILPDWFVASTLFFLVILIFQLGYYVMVSFQSIHAGMERKLLLPLFGYGFIPLILGGYLALHLEFFVSGAGRIIPNIQQLAGYDHSYEGIRIISSDSTFVLQVITIMGGLLAALYATYRVIERGLKGDKISSRALVIPYSFIVVLGALFILMM